MAPWGWFSIVVVVLASVFCARLSCETERDVATLRDSLDGLRGIAELQHDENWWCSRYACSRNRERCEVTAGAIACRRQRVAYCAPALTKGSGARMVCYPELSACMRDRDEFEACVGAE